jgi:hypothetical protein
VRFVVDQPIAAPFDRVEQALVDPAYYRALAAMPNIGEPEVLELAERGGRVDLRVRFAYTADLSGPARRVLDPTKLTWVVESTVDLASHKTTFRMVPDYYRDRIECHGVYTLQPNGPQATIQHIEGDLLVHYPIIGKLAERSIVTGLKDHMAQEAAVLERWQPS